MPRHYNQLQDIDVLKQNHKNLIDASDDSMEIDEELTLESNEEEEGNKPAWSIANLIHCSPFLPSAVIKKVGLQFEHHKNWQFGSWINSISLN
ncbi:hypothetical protein [Legionella sp. 227]|uniref:hypothetical protein n=1 Tax=Legionella sp. 227 TaxID=3367288 RepID=UPI00370D56F4